MRTTAQKAKAAERAVRDVTKDVQKWCEARGLVLWCVERSEWAACGGLNTGWTICIDYPASQHGCLNGKGATIAKAQANLLAQIKTLEAAR
jgi:hypothetical protein